ncbi:MAG: prealbumin-like fold domain-containing protein [Gordonia sp. (in: high G+C Gram-positive bacteria)]|uniref:MSCRAMM family protein n=1 Tax=Gordonia sp. (in: high G+C Gram-positive bacteria) TaxID=84139 RepID=UPI003C78B062
MNRIRRAVLAALTAPVALTLAITVAITPAFADDTGPTTTTTTQTSQPPQTSQAPQTTQTTEPPASETPPASSTPPTSTTPPETSTPPDQQTGVVTVGATDVRTGESLAGVTVQLAGPTMQRSAVTPASVDFAAGHVSATVTGVPDGYRLVSPGNLNGTLAADGTLPFFFHLLPGAVGRLTVVKVDRLTGRTLPGATFEVRSCDGGLYVRTQTLADGTFGIDELPVGCWNIIESAPPEGYLADESVHRIEVSAGSHTTVKVYDLPIGYRVTRNPDARVPLKSVPSGRMY